jgi:hypothetical protein
MRGIDAPIRETNHFHGDNPINLTTRKDNVSSKPQSIGYLGRQLRLRRTGERSRSPAAHFEMQRRGSGLTGTTFVALSEGWLRVVAMRPRPLPGHCHIHQE